MIHQHSASRPTGPLKLLRVFSGTSRRRPVRAGHSRTEKNGLPPAFPLAGGRLGWWWQVLGSNQRRLSRRFYIPEGAGRGQVGGVPVFLPFRAGFWACREEGRGQGGAPGWTNDLEAGPSPGSHWVRPGTAMGYVGGVPRAQLVSVGRLAAAFIPSGVPAAGCRGGMGRVRVRAAGSIRPGGRPPVAGASKTSDHALPASGPAHAACRDVAAARVRTSPSRIA